LVKSSKLKASMLSLSNLSQNGTLYLVDDQEAGMMYSFDNLGVCVEARQLDKEKQNHIKSN
jgi:hypothetical protein